MPQHTLPGRVFGILGLAVLVGLGGGLGSPAPRAEASGCGPGETVVFEDSFDAATPGAFPTGWTQVYPLGGGSAIFVDSSIHDGSGGNSVRMVDVSGNVFMTHTFPAQTGRFAVEWTMFSASGFGEIFLRLGKSDAPGFGEATGLGNGFGFYSNGIIGFNMGDAVIPYTVSTRYGMRLDFDIPANTFGVTIDGVTRVTGRPLGLATTALDLLEFGSSDSLNGTANIDTVQVLVPGTADTTPPSITVSGLPAEIWSPNHQMVSLTPVVAVQDTCDSSPRVTLTVTSSEPDNGLGDGDTAGDVVVRGPTDVDVRAERSGKGSGRTYTLTWTARDASENEATFTATVTVPKSQGK